MVITVTIPVLLTVATKVLADTHGFVEAGVPEPVNCVFDPTQTVKLPIIVGNGLTVTVTVFEPEQPVEVPVTVYVVVPPGVTVVVDPDKEPGIQVYVVAPVANKTDD